jgi:hypothetical protein
VDSDPDPGGPKTCGSGSGSGSGTLLRFTAKISLYFVQYFRVIVIFGGEMWKYG